MKIIVSIFLLSCFFSFTKADDANLTLITVVGQGKVVVPPDYAGITIGVTLSDPSAGQASDQVDKISADIIAYLRQNGVADQDVQTSYVSVYPNYNYDTPSFPPESYEASKTIDFSLRNLSRYDNIVQDLFEIGANTLSNVEFKIDDMKAKMKTARSRAAENAIKIAENLAMSLGYSLGNVYSIQDQSSSYDYPITYQANDQVEESSDGGSSGPSIAGGSLTVSANVQVQFFRGSPVEQTSEENQVEETQIEEGINRED